MPRKQIINTDWQGRPWHWGKECPIESIDSVDYRLSISDPDTGRFDEYKQAFRDNIKHLTRIQQDVLRLYLDGKTFCEIAEELHIYPGHAHYHIFGYKRQGKTHGGIVSAMRKLLGVTSTGYGAR